MVGFICRAYAPIGKQSWSIRGAYTISFIIQSHWAQFQGIKGLASEIFSWDLGFGFQGSIWNTIGWMHLWSRYYDVGNRTGGGQHRFSYCYILYLHSSELVPSVWCDSPLPRAIGMQKRMSRRQKSNCIIFTVWWFFQHKSTLVGSRYWRSLKIRVAACKKRLESWTSTSHLVPQLRHAFARRRNTKVDTSTDVSTLMLII